VLAAAFSTATPLVLAALGELVAEKSGVLNLSVEGLMALAAAIAFMVTVTEGSHFLGFVAGGLAAMLLSSVFAALVLFFMANQVAAGLAVGILGLGLSALLGHAYEGTTLVPPSKLSLGGLAKIPFVGSILFAQDYGVYLAFGIGILLTWFLYRTKSGLVLRVIGENPEAAHSIGFSPIAIRFRAVLFGGLMAGFAGAYASTVLTPLWSQGMIAGRGWIAVALVIFGTWRPVRIMVGAYFFGAVSMLEPTVQAMGIAIPSQIMTCLPYILTILVLAVVSADRIRIRLNAPASLGESYRPAG
jgi:general nucleoside transport system permease protein